MTTKFSRQNLIFIIIGLFCLFSWYFYRTQIINFWGIIFNKAQVVNNTAVSTSKDGGIKDCGIGMAPKLNNPSAYKNNPVLSCLGESAINCENAKAILKDDFFPNIFEIVKLPDSCNFKLSYSADSVLADITGKKLAGQYVSCPVNIVKSINSTQTTTPQFLAPDKKDLSEYASQIYFYGTLGLFLENNLDRNKIRDLGCDGEYIQSVIDSYNATTEPKI